MNDGSVNLQTLFMAALFRTLVAAAFVALMAAALVALVAAAMVALVAVAAKALVAVALKALVAAAAGALVAAAGEAAAAAEAAPAAMPADNPAPIFTQFVNALFENLSMDNDPDLQVEAAHTLIVLFDKLTLPQQQHVQENAVGVLMKRIQLDEDLDEEDEDVNDDDVGDDHPARTKAGAIVLEILNGNCDLRRNLILGPIVRGVMGNDDAIQVERAVVLRWIVGFDSPPAIQWVVETGVVPRLVEFLRRDDVPVLQHAAAGLLANIVGESDHTAVVVNANAIGPFVRLLRSPHERVQKSAVLAVQRIARLNPVVVLQAEAVGPLIALALQTREAVDAWPASRVAVSALRFLCDGEHERPFELFRPVLPAWAQLADCQDEYIAKHACFMLDRIASLDDAEHLQEVIEAGVCPRLVELLSHPSLEVQKFAIRTVANLLAHSHGQLAILDQDPLPSLQELLLSPDSDAQHVACRAIANFCFNTDQVQAVIDGDVVPTLVHLLASPTLKIQKRAAIAIVNCTASGTVDQIQVLVGEGCIPPLCRSLIVDANDPHHVTWVLSGLLDILRAGSELDQHDGSNPMAILIASSLSGERSMLLGLRRSHPDEGTRAYVHEILAECFPIEESHEEDVLHRPQ